jgi:hypothetical protein
MRILSGAGRRLNLAVTGGSDCHGFSKGKPLIGGVKLPGRLFGKAQGTQARHSAAIRQPPLLMGLFQKFKEGLLKTHHKLAHEIKRIVTASPKLTAGGLEELEAALIAADLGTAMTAQIIAAVKHAYETQGRAGLDVFAIARAEVERSLAGAQGRFAPGTEGLTVVSIVGVNGTGKTTTAAKLAHLVQARGPDGAAGGVRHLSRRRRRATQALGRAFANARHRRRSRRRPRLGGARRHRRRAGAPGRLSYLLTPPAACTPSTT